MKKLILLILIAPLFVKAQIEVVNVDPFSSVMIHPYFEIELKKGPKEKVEIMSSNVDLGLINVELNGRTLHMYLEDAKVAFKRMITDNFDEPYRDGTRVRAVVTYRDMDKLTIYGEEKVSVLNDIDQRKFQLKIYGDAEIDFQSIFASEFKVGMYGDNKLLVEGGDVSKQIYSMYGDNEIRAKKLSGSFLRLANFGDNKIYVGKQEYVRVTAFGDATVSYIGYPELDQRIAIGEMTYVSR